MQRKMSNEYLDCSKLLNTKKYPEAIAAFELLRNEGQGIDKYIALGGIGYAFFKQKNFIGALRRFENKDFLRASTHPDFEKYLIVWATVYYNLGSFNKFDDILYNLKYFNPNDGIKGKNDEANVFKLVDNLGRAFNPEHRVWKFIQALSEWKFKQNLIKAQELFKESGLPQAQQIFMPVLLEDLKKLKVKGELEKNKKDLKNKDEEIIKIKEELENKNNDLISINEEINNMNSEYQNNIEKNNKNIYNDYSLFLNSISFINSDDPIQLIIEQMNLGIKLIN